MSGLVTFGETMALLANPDDGLLRHATELQLRIGGAESNVAIGMRRLGLPASWMGRVGEDEFGALILSRLRGEQVDVGGATIDPDARTGLMVKSSAGAGATHVLYYRRDSAGSRLAPEHLDEEAIRSADVLHVSGITPALSRSARDTTYSAIEIARAAGVTVSFDLNHRSTIWDQRDARRVYRDLAGLADVILAAEHECRFLLDVSDGVGPRALAEAIASLGPIDVVVKRGRHGAGALVDGVWHEVEAVPVTEIDPVGAGDGFSAGYLAGRCTGLDASDRLRQGARVGAFAVTSRGDWESLPHRDQLDRLEEDDVRR